MPFKHAFSYDQITIMLYIAMAKCHAHVRILGTNIVLSCILKCDLFVHNLFQKQLISFNFLFFSFLVWFNFSFHCASSFDKIKLIICNLQFHSFLLEKQFAYSPSHVNDIVYNIIFIFKVCDS